MSTDLIATLRATDEEISPLYRRDAADLIEQQAAEITTLRTTVECLEASCRGALKYSDGQAAEIARLRAEVDALRVDAERYRYLRNRVPAEVFDARGLKAGAWIDCEDDAGQLTLLTGEDADQTIDAARAAREST